MASLLNNASLLLNPAGSIISYQEDKIYSVLPKNGTGDFTFSGGDGGTRVNQQGYIEQTPFNLFQYSNAFNTSPWDMAVTGGQTGKDGAANAWLLTKAGVTTSDLYNALTVDGEQTFSIYVKKESSKGIKVYNFGTINNFVTINIDTGANLAQSGAGVISYKAVEYNASWWRVQITMNCTNGKWYIYVTDGSGTQIQSSITIQDAQLAVGSDPKPYQPTTDRLNYPRITYQNGRGALLSEPQRTNKQTSSESINGTDYSNNNQITISSDFGISPDGTQNADKIIATTTNDYHQIRTNKATPNGYDIISCFVKASGYNFVQLMSYADPVDYVNFDLQNGTVGTVSTATIYGIENYGNGWYRIYANVKGSGSGLVGIGIITSATAGWSQAFAGNGTDGILVWGVQIEVGSFPTSYIPTTSATVTRPADSTNNTNTTNVASVVGQTEGVFYSDLFFEANGAERNYMYLNTNGSYFNGFLYLVGTATNKLGVDIYNNPNTQQFSAQSPTLTTGRYKAAIAYKQNDFAFYLNGVQIAIDNSGTVPTLNRMYIGQGSDLGWTNGASVFTTGFFPTRLTNTQLAELTTVRSGSGGNISYYGPYTIHTFTGSATFTPSFTGPVEVLVVAGGGGGGQFHGGGGGGAGGLLYTSAYSVSAGSGITVTVGSGGSVAGAGSNTVFGGLIAIGGGFGATEGPNNGGNGGSGGGGTGFSTPTNGGLGTPGQGFDGGKGAYPSIDATYGSGGGGGGASAPGTDGKEGQNVSGSAGNGGNGLPYSINGFSTYYAGGGGGGYWGDNLTYYGVGGLGGGGNGGAGGSASTLLPTPGVNGLGGGGGGSRGDGSLPRPGSTGGSGVVIVRYLT